MTGSDILAIVGAAIAVAGVVVAFYYGRKALAIAKHELSWEYDSIPLISQLAGPYRDAIDLSINGRSLNDPHLLRLTISNRGRLDIDSSRFDQSRPLVFELDRIKYIHVIEVGSPAIVTGEASISVGAELLRAGESWTVTMITERSARVALAENHLIDVQVRHVSRSSGEGGPGWALISAAAGVTSIIMVGFLSVLQRT